MRVKQEDFDSLSQLDRIEYRQVEDRIYKYFKPNATISCFIALTILSFMVVCFLLIMKQLNFELFTVLLYKFKNLFFIYGIFFLTCPFMDLILINKKNKHLNELDSKYFKHEVKKQK